MKVLNSIMLAILIIGAINWGSVGLFKIDLVATLFGASTILSTIVYVLVAIAGIWAFTFFKKIDDVREEV